MVNKTGNLSLQEKRRIEELIKCQRERKRVRLLEVLAAKREAIEKPYNEKIKKLEEEREGKVKDAGYSKIYERGCYDKHIELDKFDAETNKQLIELWQTAEPVEGQFIEPE